MEGGYVNLSTMNICVIPAIISLSCTSTCLDLYTTSCYIAMCIHVSTLCIQGVVIPMGPVTYIRDSLTGISCKIESSIGQKLHNVCQRFFATSIKCIIKLTVFSAIKVRVHQCMYMCCGM